MLALCIAAQNARHLASDTQSAKSKVSRDESMYAISNGKGSSGKKVEEKGAGLRSPDPNFKMPRIQLRVAYMPLTACNGSERHMARSTISDVILPSRKRRRDVGRFELDRPKDVSQNVPPASCPVLPSIGEHAPSN